MKQLLEKIFALFEYLQDSHRLDYSEEFLDFKDNLDCFAEGDEQRLRLGIKQLFETECSEEQVINPSLYAEGYTNLLRSLSDFSVYFGDCYSILFSFNRALHRKGLLNLKEESRNYLKSAVDQLEDNLQYGYPIIANDAMDGVVVKRVLEDLVALFEYLIAESGITYRKEIAYLKKQLETIIWNQIVTLDSAIKVLSIMKLNNQDDIFDRMYFETYTQLLEVFKSFCLYFSICHKILFDINYQLNKLDFK